MPLAEPRFKRKGYLILNPRGKLWTQDKNTTSRKLMEKMGWSEGDGLGKDLQGDKDPIALKSKDDCKGLGYKVKDHEWVKLHTGYESVLADLNTENNSVAACAVSDEEVSRPLALESLSKSFQSRLHYGKFTRGKDLSLLSSDEIGCITGAKMAKKLGKIAKEEKEKEKNDRLFEAKSTDQGTSNLQTINCGSMEDYFKKKMALLKSKANQQESHIFEETKIVPGLEFEAAKHDSALEEQVKCIAETKSKKKKREKGENDNTESNNYPIVEDNLLLKEQEEIVVKTEKKRKKQRHVDSNRFVADEQEECIVETAVKKKKEKSKEQRDTESNSHIAIEDNYLKEQECLEIKSKKKKKKEQDRTEFSSFCMDQDNISLKEQEECVVETERKKKKKKKKTQEMEIENEHSAQEKTSMEEQAQCSHEPKKKKRKAKDADYDSSLENLNTDCDVRRKSKKLKKNKVPKPEKQEN